MSTPKRAASPGGSLHARTNLPPKEAPTPAPTITAPQHVEPVVNDSMEARKQLRAPIPVLESIRRFFLGPTGLLRILRMFLIIGAAVFFTISEAPESYIVITILETCIIFFFTIVDMLTLHHLMRRLDWPLLDLANSLITAVFFSVIGIVALNEGQRESLFYTGGGLCMAVAFLCLVDAFLLSKTVTNKVRMLLCLEEKSKKASASLTSTVSRVSIVPSLVSLRAPSRTVSKPPSLTSLQAPLPQEFNKEPLK